MFSGGKNHLTTKDNRGLTLVELLVAVVIFSIAIVPMLYAFVYSTGYNFKAQQTLQSTGIAQAIIEKAKAPGVTLDEIETAIMADTLLDSSVFSRGAASNTGSHTYRIENVKAVNLTEDTVSRRVYDVEISLSPGSTYNTSVIRSMSDDTANFTDYSSNFTSSLLLYEDQRAVDKIVELIKTNMFTDSHITVKDSSGNVVPSGSWPVEHPGTLLTEADIDKDNLIIRRVIKIDCSSANGVVVSVDYYCGGFYSVNYSGDRTLGSVLKVSKDVTIGGSSYSISCSGGINGAGTSYSIITSGNLNPGAGDNPFYQATYNGSNSFTICPAATDALFFYYYPGYETTTSSNAANFYDSFIIKSSINQADVSGTNGVFDMYFYKQLNTSLSTAELNQGEYNYAPYFNINNSGNMTINFYNNFLNDVRDTDYYDSTYGILSAHSGSYANKLQSNGTSVLLDFTGNVENKTLLPTSVPAGTYDWDGSNVLPYESVVTTYTITVSVYKDGETTPIETMSGEVINW